MRKLVLLLVIIGCAICLNACGGGPNTTIGLSNSETPGASQDAAQESSPNKDLPRIAVDAKEKKPVSVPDAVPRTGGIPLNVHVFDGGSFDPDGEIVKWEWNFSGKHNGKGGWHDYTATKGDAWHVFTKPGKKDVKLRVTDDDGRKDVESVSIEMREGNNANPVAVASSDINSGNAPLTVTFSAFGSYDPDGFIVNWEWDFDDGAGFQDFTAEQGEVSHDYLNGGLFAATLRITDDDGAVSTNSVEIVVAASGQWHILVVDSVGNTGFNCSLIMVNTHPAIAYYNRTGADLKYVRAGDEWGLAWGAPVTVDPGDIHPGLSMTVVDGSPAISYDMGFLLKYVRAQDAQGSTWGTPVTVDGGRDLGESNSLAVVNGRPAISYFDRAGNMLKYVHALDSHGATWDLPIAPDSGRYVGIASSLNLVAGYPVITYQDQTNGDLKYVRALDINGTNWGVPFTIDSVGSVGSANSLAVIDGMPAVTYYDMTNGWIKYVRATQTDGSAWGTPVPIADNIGYTGSSTSLAILNGKPATAYYEGGNGDLKLVRATDAMGANWGTPELVDGIGIVGGYASMLIIAGSPAIAYNDYTNGDLKFAIFN